MRPTLPPRAPPKTLSYSHQTVLAWGEKTKSVCQGALTVREAQETRDKIAD